MGNRVRSVEEKVQAVKVALAGVNVEQAARAAGVPASTLRYDLKKVIGNLESVLANQPPGPPRRPPEVVGAPLERERPGCCPAGGHERIWKNGGSWVLNWVAML